MTISAVDFFNLASKLLPLEFEGSHPQFVLFLDALELLKLNCGEHEANAVAFVETRLTGKAPDLITSEKTLNEIIDTLKGGVRSKSKCKRTLLSTQQKLNLKRTYITEGVPNQTADSYTVDAIVKILGKNANSDNARMIMEAGTFNTVQDALSKFVTITIAIHLKVFCTTNVMIIEVAPGVYIARCIISRNSPVMRIVNTT